MLSLDPVSATVSTLKSPLPHCKLVAVGGGRGGVGKSLLAVNLAVYLAHLGKRVVLVDAEPMGSNLHAHFGLPAAIRPLDLHEGATTSALVSTSLPGLSLLSSPHDALMPALTVRTARIVRWIIRHGATLDADFLVVDTGAGYGPLPLDLFLRADVPLLVTVPEPSALEALYRFLRTAYLQTLRRTLHQDPYQTQTFERALRRFDALPSPLALVQALARMESALADFAWAKAHSMYACLVVNQTRLRADIDLGLAVSELVKQHYGISLQELGHIEYDDQVSFAARAYRPLLIESPHTRASRNVERIARKLLTPLHAEEQGTPRREDSPNAYEILGISNSSSDQEIRRAHKRKRDIYLPGSLMTWGLTDEQTLHQTRADIDQAGETLLHAQYKSVYDASLLPEKPCPTHRAPVLDVPPESAEELARLLHPHTVFSGKILQRVRELHGKSLAEIAAQTRITQAHLEAIEIESLTSLPSPVYLRGYLFELAKQLGLDPGQVYTTYVRRRNTTSPLPVDVG